MRKSSITGISIAMVFSLVCAGALFAADYGAMQGGERQMGTSKANITNPQVMMERGSQIIGMSVVNLQGEYLGRINDIALDSRSGRVTYAVLGAGAVTGMSDKYFAIPWHSLSFNTAGDMLILNIDKDRLKNAPSFDKNNWPDFTDRTWGASIHRFYGQRPYWHEESAQ